MKGYKFVDTAKVFLFGGKGGDGCASFRREKYVPRGGPDGGDGGRGADVIFQVDKQTDSLIHFYYQPHQRGQDGVAGKGKKKHGRNSKDLVLKVPPGTVISDEATGMFLGELLEDGAQLVVARGGKGGLGNCHWSTRSNRAPRGFTLGAPGEEKTVRLDLKIIADVCLIGFPNAGKSTLISTVSDAHPKIAAYPFTTLNPIMGTIKSDYGDVKVVDVPGLIKGAHTGTGLGHTFLRHVERTKLLLFVIDMAGADGRDPVDDFMTLRREIELHKKELVQRHYLVVANKMDLERAGKNLPFFIRKTGEKPVPISALKKQGVDKLRNLLCDLILRCARH